VGYGVACLTSIAVALAALWMLYGQSADRQAVLISAAGAFAVQLAGFVTAQALMRQDVMIGWGAGVGVRFLALALYAFVVIPRFGLPLSAGLVSFALFLFLSTLVEPFFLRK
jgi:hypothetical protein